MDPISPTRTTTTVARGNACAFVLSFAIVIYGMTSATKSPGWIVVMSMGCLVFGWLLTATLITHVTSDRGLVCEQPDVQNEFHALSRVPVLVRIQNPSDRSPVLFLTAEIVAECDGILLNSPLKFVGQLPAHRSAEFEWRLNPRKRGEYVLRGLVAHTAFPGSMLARDFSFSFDRRLLALPAVYRLKPKMDQLLAGRKRATGRQPSKPAAMEEFFGVREYRPGDNPRNVSLALSMRMPDYPWQLVVREFENPSDDEVCVVLDTAAPTPDEEDSVLVRYRFEKSISFAVALCRQLCELKHRVRFLACQDSGELVEIRLTRPSRDVPALERKLARFKTIQDPQASIRLLKKQSEASDAIVLFVSLREGLGERIRNQDLTLCLTPEWQTSLVAEVAA